MTRVRIAVIFGGRSTEHSISCVSAGSVLACLDPLRYDVVAVGITPDGHWVLASSDPKALAAGEDRLPTINDASGLAVALPGDPGVDGLVVLAPGDGPRILAGVDVVFPLLHGPFGEDGTVQGLLELAGLPYVGSGVLASAVSMDKEFMKLVLAARGLPVGPYAVLHASGGADGATTSAAVEALGWPVFVKPSRGGSSIGISRVDGPEGLVEALQLAWVQDPKALVEAAVPGREIECGVLAGIDGGPPEASSPAEVRVTSGGFYDFDAKYLDDSTEFDVPAVLSADLTAAVQELACRAFLAVGAEGLARVDFFLRPDGELVINELNTMPGFTPQSMFPRMWAASGLDYPALIDRLVRTALQEGTGLR
ncbi:MAG TPA: D-alanine--D-alanine ligase family protein [Mycobacteriales bacterium]|nr:D-alanine--D-alanine ligase family protein [Mycobacteriales bacterium]